MEKLSQYIESIIFVSENGATLHEIFECLKATTESDLNRDDIKVAIEELLEKYRNDQYPFEIKLCGGGYQFMTKSDYAEVIGTYLNQKSKRRLSRAALETLSIIAYKQPVGKAEIESIRGVSCDYTIHKLLEKEMISIIGRADTPGKPLLYGTSESFMDYFGINSPADLPKLKDIESSHDNEIGESPEIEVEDGSAQN